MAVDGKGFDVDICRTVAAAMFGDADAIEFTIVMERPDLNI